MQKLPYDQPSEPILSVAQGLPVALFRIVVSIAHLFGTHARKFFSVWPGLVWYVRQKQSFEASYACSTDQSFAPGPLRPCLLDRYRDGGTASGYHFQLNLIAAQLVYAAKPTRHVDVGSLVEQFVGHVAVFCPVEVIDFRPITTTARNISFRQVDIIRGVPDLDGSCNSLSCLDALECFGLGRYGEPIDPDGHRKGFATLARMLRPGGAFYFAVPISASQRYEFNAHRLFALPYLTALFEEHNLDVESFHYVDDQGAAHHAADWRGAAAKTTFGLHFGAGIFALRRRHMTTVPAA